VAAAKLADLGLEGRLDLRRREPWPCRARLQARESFGEVAPPVEIERLAGDPSPAADIGDRVARAPGLSKYLQLEFVHRHHLQRHLRLLPSLLSPRARLRSEGGRLGGVRDVSGTSGMCPERSVSDVSGMHIAFPPAPLSIP